MKLNCAQLKLKPTVLRTEGKQHDGAGQENRLTTLFLDPLDILDQH